MTIRKMCGFETDLTIIRGDSVAIPGTGTPTITNSQRHQTLGGAGGERSIQLGNGGNVTFTTTGVSDSEEFHFAVRHSVGGGWEIQFIETTSNQVNIELSNTDSLLRVRRGSGVGTLLASSSATIPALTWNTYKVSITAKELASGGRCIVFLNGSSTPLVDTGIADLRNTTTDHFSSVRYTSVGQSWLDDYFQGSSGSLPDEPLYIQLIRPLSQSFTQGVPSTGTSNTATVDEDPVDTSDYNELLTSGHEDRFYFTTMSFAPGQVLAVRPMAYMTGEGSITTGRTLVEISGSTTYGTNRALQTGGTYGVVGDIFEISPSSSISFTGAEVNGMIGGYEAN